MRIVDTHLHLWDPLRFSYPWLAGVPTLNRRFTLEDYEQAATGLGITKAIFMECDVAEASASAEAEAIQALASGHPLIAGIVASARPERSDFPAQLERLARVPKLRGLRRVLHTQADELATRPEFAANLKRLPALGLTFDLCVLARQLPVAIALVRHCPTVTFILDHCGVPEVRSGVLQPWQQQLTELARFPNVFCKVSGLVAYADPATWTVDQLRPWVDHVMTEFGWDRIFWGGDWPVCTLGAPLARWVEATHALVNRGTAIDRAKFFHLNAERLYRV